MKEPLYAMDSTTIDLCLKLFPWADFRSTKAAVKAHTVIDLRGAIPVMITITTGKVHDVKAIDSLQLPPSSIVVLDRGYVDFARLYALVQRQCIVSVRPTHIDATMLRQPTASSCAATTHQCSYSSASVNVPAHPSSMHTGHAH